MAGINLKKIRQALISVKVPLEILPTKGKISKNIINNNNKSNIDSSNNSNNDNNDNINTNDS